jgi:hydroxypyruvate isomerase
MAKFSVCVDLVLRDFPFLDRIDRVADAGYSAFEFWFWTGKDLPAILKKKQARGLATSIMSCSSKANSRFEDWRFPCLTDPQFRGDFVRAVEESVEVARLLGSPTINLLTGCAVDHLSPEAQWTSVIAGLREAAPVAEEHGIVLALEPLNVAVDHAGYFLQTIADAMRVIREVNRPSVKMLFDIYHQQVTEGNIIQKLTENIGAVAHIHLADVPGRHEPGTGELNYPNIIRAVDRAGYPGYIGFEYAPVGDPVASLRAMRTLFA